MMMLPTIAQLPHTSKADLQSICDQIRWPDGPTCPRCGHDKYYVITRDRQWDCKKCRRRYSSTTGTILGERRMPLVEYFRLIAFFVANAKGIPSRQLAMMTGHQHKTTHRFMHLLRTVMLREQHSLMLSGVVEIDGALFGGYRWKQNKSGDGNRRAYYTRGDAQTVTVVRERAGRTITFVGKRERDARPFIQAHVLPGTTIHCDMASEWTPLAEFYSLMRINHRLAYSMNGCCTNWAESYFSRLRRMQHGVYHRMSGKYLNLYAAEGAWREDFRKSTFQERFHLLLGAVLQQPPLVARGNHPVTLSIAA